MTKTILTVFFSETRCIIHPKSGQVNFYTAIEHILDHTPGCGKYLGV